MDGNAKLIFHSFPALPGVVLVHRGNSEVMFTRGGRQKKCPAEGIWVFTTNYQAEKQNKTKPPNRSEINILNL